MPIDASLLPDWDAFDRDYIVDGVPRTFVVRSEPAVHVFIDAGASRLGLRIRLGADAPAAVAPPMQEIRTADISVGGLRHMEVSTESRALYPNFFRLVSEVAADVIAGHAPAAALAEAVARWDALLRRPQLLSEEQQAGLFGELWFLHRLLQGAPPAPLSSWTGPLREAHDFRVGATEFEVKTTSSAERVHTINGLGQLDPSPDCRLFVVSLQLADGGSGGQTLEQAVAAVRARLPGSAVLDFAALLDRVGYRGEDAALYPRRRRLRTPPVLVPVVDGCPRLVADALSTLPSRFAPQLIRNATYQVDLTDLGAPDGSPAFLEVVPAAPGAPV
ncbi:MAG: PD-(D/E)XK motif protein [Caulobacter sp.]|nr:PD-(D/E)XK motif protein [Caulobacter sp.]